MWRVQASGLCLVLLSTHQDAFHSLSDAAKRLQSELQGEGTFQVCCSSSLHTAINMPLATLPGNWCALHADLQRGATASH